MPVTHIYQAVAALGFCILLAGFSVLALAPPGTDLGIFAQTGDDRLGHLTVFFLLTPLAFAAFAKVPAGWVLAGLLFLAGALEGGQAFSGREVSAEDLIANLAGIVAGLYPKLLWQLRAVQRDRSGQPGIQSKKDPAG